MKLDWIERIETILTGVGNLIAAFIGVVAAVGVIALVTLIVKWVWTHSP